MILRVLITRPESAVQDYVRELQSDGFKTFLAPMLNVVSLPFEISDDYDVLIFTSAEGVRSYWYGGGGIKGQAICVGKYTAQVAQESGFKDVINVTGTGKDIVKHILNEHTNQSVCSLRICHVGGKHVAYPIAEKLGEANIACAHIPVYEAQKVGEIPLDVIDAMTGKCIDVVMFYSKRTAENFLDLIAENGLSEYLKDIKCLLISDAVLECVRLYNYEWNGLYVSSTPDRAGMLEQLKVIEGEMKDVSKSD